MKPENIAYAAKINAACWLILQASKIAKRLADTTSEQRQAIEDEIVEIGHRLYREATHEAEPEATPEPGGDYQLGLYANAVVELDACVEMWFIEDGYRHGFTPEQTIERWRNHVSYSKGRAQR